MNEETAKELAAAMNRLAAAIERASGGLGTIGGGLHIYHHGAPQYPNPQPSPFANPWQTTCGSPLTGIGIGNLS